MLIYTLLQRITPQYLLSFYYFQQLLSSKENFIDIFCIIFIAFLFVVFVFIT